jgi:hypothetical protein
MPFIYIKNYLDISRDEKLEFFILIKGFKNFNVTNQKILLSDNSLLLQLDEQSDKSFAMETIKKFFIDKGDMEVCLVKEILQSQNDILLTFEDNEQKRIKL